MRTMRKRPTTRSSGLQSPGAISCHYMAEPLLLFGEDGLHIDPKSGIARFGPRSYGMAARHPATARVGIIGTADTVEKARAWLESGAEGVRGNAKHPEFPGYKRDRGYFSALEFADAWVEQITQTEVRNLTGIRSSRSRFEETVTLLDHKLRLVSGKDLAPNYLVLALPDGLTKRARATDYKDKELGEVHRDLRRAIKAVAMRHRLPTQILSQDVTEGREDDHPAKIAWNYFTGLYAKVGGIPWSPHGLTPATCYVGISFFRPLGSKVSTLRTSLVQAFDEYGEGLVLRGPDFEWDPRKEGSPAPHISAEHARELIDKVLARYRDEMKQAPQRVVVHKTSRYLPAEREGFIAALQGRVAKYDLVALEQQSDVRLITESKYPPLRGTSFRVGDLDYLYTTGYIAALEEYHGMGVPSPLRIADHVGQDTSRDTLLREILTLTKLNWNSAHFAGSLPITLKFSRLVGDIMREIPPDREPLPQYKFYM